jgi:hypothetical protein
MDAEPVGDQHGADHQQEAERQHHDRRVGVDEVRQRLGSEQHHHDGDDHGDEHHRQKIGHADRGEDRIH